MSSINMSTGVSVEKLDGTNYHVWKFKMQLVLEDKELFGVIDGTDVKAEGSAEYGLREMLKGCSGSGCKTKLCPDHTAIYRTSNLCPAHRIDCAIPECG